MPNNLTRLEHNASNQLYQTSTTLAKTRPTKHVHLWNLVKTVTIRKLTTAALTEITSEFEFE